MTTAELLPVTAYREVFVSVEEGTGAEVYAFRCNICDRTLTDGPCPDHAPLDVPGLRPVGCWQQPPHLGWVVDAEDYGAPCPWCERDDCAGRVADLEVARDRHGRWRGSRAASWLLGKAYAAGLIAGYSVGTCRQPGHRWCAGRVSWRGRRPYVLGFRREEWRCILRYRHWPADPIIFGFCSKCMPCPDCGSRTAGHETGCPAVTG
jgi:hypothetical protein